MSTAGRALCKEMTKCCQDSGMAVQRMLSLPQGRAQIKNKWKDVKCRAKKKASENLLNMQGTGGGPRKFTPLTPTEELIIQKTVGWESIHGVGGVDSSKHLLQPTSAAPKKLHSQPTPPAASSRHPPSPRISIIPCTAPATCSRHPPSPLSQASSNHCPPTSSARTQPSPTLWTQTSPPLSLSPYSPPSSKNSQYPPTNVHNFFHPSPPTASTSAHSQPCAIPPPATKPRRSIHYTAPATCSRRPPSPLSQASSNHCPPTLSARTQPSPTLWTQTSPPLSLSPYSPPSSKNSQYPPTNVHNFFHPSPPTASTSAHSQPCAIPPPATKPRSGKQQIIESSIKNSQCLDQILTTLKAMHKLDKEKWETKKRWREEEYQYKNKKLKLMEQNLHKQK